MLRHTCPSPIWPRAPMSAPTQTANVELWHAGQRDLILSAVLVASRVSSITIRCRATSPIGSAGGRCT